MIIKARYLKDGAPHGKDYAFISNIDVKVGDRFLVCSDGLSSVLTEKEIKSLLKGKDRDAAVAALVDAPYINGAPDNVTLVIGDIVEENQPDTFETIGAAG